MNACWIYGLTMNSLGFFAMGLDKGLSKTKKRRIPEKKLLGVAALGGAWGCLLGMWLFRHKTKHKKFSLGLPFLSVVWLVVVWKIVGSWRTG